MQLAAASMMFPCRHLHLQQHCYQRVPQDCGAMATDSKKINKHVVVVNDIHDWGCFSKTSINANMQHVFTLCGNDYTVKTHLCETNENAKSCNIIIFLTATHQSSEIPHMQTTTFNKNMLAKHVTFQVDHCEHLFQTNEV